MLIALLFGVWLLTLFIRAMRLALPIILLVAVYLTSARFSVALPPRVPDPMLIALVLAMWLLTLFIRAMRLALPIILLVAVYLILSHTIAR